MGGNGCLSQRRMVVVENVAWYRKVAAPLVHQSIYLPDHRCSAFPSKILQSAGGEGSGFC